MSLPEKPREMDYAVTSRKRLAQRNNAADAWCNQVHCTETLPLLEDGLNAETNPHRVAVDEDWIICQLTGRSPVLLRWLTQP